MIFMEFLKLQPRLEWMVSRPTRPKWYMLSFWSMKIPLEMEMKDMKTCQMRRKESIDRVCTPIMEVACGGRRKAPWTLLRSLACRVGLDDYTLSSVRFMIWLVYARVIWFWLGGAVSCIWALLSGKKLDTLDGRKCHVIVLYFTPSTMGSTISRSSSGVNIV